MAELGAEQALNETLYQALNGASLLWGENVSPVWVASADLARPFVCWWLPTGGRELVIAVRNHARFVVNVKVVAESLEDALRGQADVSALLSDSGRQDVKPRLPEHGEWWFLTVTEDRLITENETFSGTQKFYHRGYQYIIEMEEKERRYASI